MENNIKNTKESFQIFLEERNIPDPDELLGKALRYLKNKGQIVEFKGFNKAYINPHILEIGGEEVSMEEGCLSLPGIHETVKRGNKIRVKYMDEDFVDHEEEVEGYLARVMQHEFDHLDGKMFIDHISALRKQMIKGKLNTMLKGKARSSYKMKQVK